MYAFWKLTGFCQIEIYLYVCVNVMLSSAKQSEHDKQIRKPGQVWCHSQTHRLPLSEAEPTVGVNLLEVIQFSVSYHKFTFPLFSPATTADSTVPKTKVWNPGVGECRSRHAWWAWAVSPAPNPASGNTQYQIAQRKTKMFLTAQRGCFSLTFISLWFISVTKY